MKELKKWIQVISEIDNIPEIPEELVPAIKAIREKMLLVQTRQKESEDLLAFYKEALNQMPNPVFIKDEKLKFIFFNNAYREYFGRDIDMYLGKSVLDLEYLSSDERARYSKEDRDALENVSIIQYETIFNVSEQEASEALYWSKGFEVPVTNDKGLVGEIVDISSEKKIQRELARNMIALEVLMQDAKIASEVDPSTQLLNRRAFADKVTPMIEEAQKSEYPVCAIIMDIDYFKRINDTYGHVYGDETLEKFAGILKYSFRKSDMLIRYGGDEFVAILQGANINQAKKSAERLCNRVSKELILLNGEPVTLSVGITQLLADDNVLSFLSRADEALYLAKSAGRNRISVKE